MSRKRREELYDALAEVLGAEATADNLRAFVNYWGVQGTERMLRYSAYNEILNALDRAVDSQD
jgi:hypothetical protein